MPDLEERVAALEAAVDALTAPEPRFMEHTRVEPIDGEYLHVCLTHLPTKTAVLAADRTEGVFKLRKALAARLRREYDLQEKQRRAECKAAGEASGAA